MSDDEAILTWARASGIMTTEDLREGVIMEIISTADLLTLHRIAAAVAARYVEVKT